MNSNVFLHETKISEKDKSELIKQQGIVIWFTGLSGAGKSTLAAEFEKYLYKKRKLTCLLDGDNIRFGLNRNLGFSEDDRTENIRRIAEVAKLFADNAVITLVSFISPKIAMRENARKIIGAERFYEIFVDASIEKCAARDVKGLYKKAMNGTVKNFTGITAEYEKPENPFAVISTDNDDIEESLSELIKYFEDFGF
ncbi:adenylyl-sulfate kinase [Candidatus Dependentiae bacterium]|nr:adenylyl-sulfate kinase [Candidatus Dependentiae bacterium]